MLSAAGRITNEGLAAFRETPPTVSVFFISLKTLSLTFNGSIAVRQHENEYSSRSGETELDAVAP